MPEDTSTVAEGSETETKPTPKPKPRPTPEKTETVSEPVEFTADDVAELERLRKFRAEASKWEKRAKTNFDDAQRYRELVEQLAGTEKDAGEFDAKAAFEALNSKLESAETERLRADVARTENVNPKYITGTTEDEMRAAAQEFRADVEQLIEASRAAEVKTAAAPPASSVTGNGRITGPQQITSREQLKSMSSRQIQEAMKAGELDQLLGKH